MIVLTTSLSHRKEWQLSIVPYCHKKYIDDDTRNLSDPMTFCYHFVKSCRLSYDVAQIQKNLKLKWIQIVSLNVMYQMQVDNRMKLFSTFCLYKSTKSSCILKSMKFMKSNAKYYFFFEWTANWFENKEVVNAIPSKLKSIKIVQMMVLLLAHFMTNEISHICNKI